MSSCGHNLVVSGLTCAWMNGLDGREDVREDWVGVGGIVGLWGVGDSWGESGEGRSNFVLVVSNVAVV